MWRQCFECFFPFFVCISGLKRGVSGVGLGFFGGEGGLESTIF